MEIEIEYVTVYTTFPSKVEAKETAKILVTEKLAACANLIDQMESIYVWNEQLEESTEVVCLLKTTMEKSEPLMQRIRELHSYETPCIVGWPILKGNPNYLDWIRKSL
ncbi:MAG: divalent-cation tolerance protein CutA [Leptospira sp.]|uniref:Divalent-cation tolerance protein CutA n=1 Tax=Leptospira paudalimensis TaxID=2950024 RepID=A0ABT3M9K7_9LEPT|nr:MULTISPECIES: divalent-cation tolerance protein CutA [Leptospira]MBL0955916.1 divalent-cation tolerance protein CutA [Leptospira sp.]MCW7505063.1 divalent-cation tolerance protein CutA [Leptospira paudalimensis]